MTKVDEAYEALNGLVAKAKEIAESVEDEFEYSPFKYIDGPIVRAASEIRPKLVEHYVKKYNREYSPNYDPKEKFKDMMDEAVGRDSFSSEVIRAYFKNLASDVEKLRELSWKQVKERAAHLRGGSYYNKPKLSEIVQGNVLLLRAHTWSKYSSNSKGYVTYYSKDNYETMQSLIEVVTLKTDPAQRSKNTFLTDHLENREPEQFYGKHTVKHRTVEAFQFYKNDKLKIWFKKPRYAKAVAEELVSVSFT